MICSDSPGSSASSTCSAARFAWSSLPPAMLPERSITTVTSRAARGRSFGSSAGGAATSKK
ncbi:MAG: hypothetical protein U1E76_24655 [Planctomycetota bacterium]